MLPINRIRNFSIIAHIDHGKSTLADRMLEITGTISSRERRDQFLDNMELERERGITIKAQTVRIQYRAKDGQEYLLNLIDTPGHVDFSYEVSRSLAACEGAVLVVDASQGVQAQTLAHTVVAVGNGLTIIPVLNKIDLPSADPERICQEIEDILGISTEHAVRASAKSGAGVDEILEAIIRDIPAPAGRAENPLQGLVFDSWYDSYVGVIALVRIVQGILKKNMKFKLASTGQIHEVTHLGVMTPHATPVDQLGPGEVGFVASGIRDIHELRIGDTVMDPERPADPLPGFKKVRPMVFAGFYPVESASYDDLKDALDKLRLNDASFTFEPETSAALGFGFRCGFMGLLHMEIIKERLSREYAMNLISTAPMVVYRIKTTAGDEVEIDNPAKLPDASSIEDFFEPYVKVTIFSPPQFIGPLIQLCQERRGAQIDLLYPTPARAELIYEIPFAEIMFDFYDRLKSVTQGYASLDYDILDYRPADLVKLNLLINDDPVDALSLIVHREQAYVRGRAIVAKLREVIPRQMYEVAIQAAVGSRIIARESVKALRKNVTAKCYGGDITRKRKLLEKQKEGKKKMKQVGKVELPEEAFLAVLKVD